MIHRADVLGRITADLKTQAPDHIAVSKCRSCRSNCVLR